ncbi:MarR family transcriptional regulator [Pontibacter sp. G13]|uniref:MarR family winged helix-turn-helix transcriptional regulator n=1 Tax=Pontibacter sp. G13 TaxID=3074898 RepID=UPI002889A84B|nr:MarR family transcriptional regulator [Pontibacter sp. G13]WNJ21014.1 MarR family transcriptional regulator [Pontibacter sp. G13]
MHDNHDSHGDPLERLEHSLFQLTDVIQKHQEIVQKRFKVSAVEIDILKLLEGDGDKKMKDIGERVSVKLSNLTNIIDRMETQKLVKRVNSKTDRRSIFVNVTTKGKKLLSDYSELLRELSTRMRDVVRDEEFDVLVKGLEQISKVTVIEQ